VADALQRRNARGYQRVEPREIVGVFGIEQLARLAGSRPTESPATDPRGYARGREHRLSLERLNTLDRETEFLGGTVEARWLRRRGCEPHQIVGEAIGDQCRAIGLLDAQEDVTCVDGIGPPSFDLDEMKPERRKHWLGHLANTQPEGGIGKRVDQ